MDFLSNEQQQFLQNKLESDIEELERFLATETASKTVELDQSRMGRLARIDAIQSQQASKKQMRQMAEQLRSLKRARAKMNNRPEDFGYCVRCDEPIPFQRLMLRPFSQKCVPCLESRD